MQTDMPKMSPMAWITGLMVLGGLAAGPGYFVYCMAFSGKKVATYSMDKQQGRYRPVTLALDPEMNLILLKVHARVEGSSSNSPTSLRVWLREDRTELLGTSVTFSIERDKDRADNASIVEYQAKALDQFSVPSAGKYTFSVEEPRAGHRSVQVSNLEVEVRRNAKAPNMKIVWWGVGILVAGFVLGWLTDTLVPGRREDD